MEMKQEEKIYNTRSNGLMDYIYTLLASIPRMLHDIFMHTLFDKQKLVEKMKQGNILVPSIERLNYLIL
jgi:hypothetical protein